MNPVVRIFGRMLRLVGISSPEDSLPREKSVGDPPSWRDQKTDGTVPSPATDQPVSGSKPPSV